MKVAPHSVLHVLDMAPKFGASRFLFLESMDIVWNVFDVMWAQVDVGTPDAVATDFDSVFSNGRWAALIPSHKIGHQIFSFEGHNALEKASAIFFFLCRMFQKEKTDSPSLSDDHALALATMASNDLAEPSNLMPTLLLFGVLPQLPLDPQPLPDNLRRTEALMTASEEIPSIIAAERIFVALRKNVPAGADTDIRAGDLALWYKKKPTRCWAGPFLNIGREGTLMRPDYRDRQAMDPVNKVKRYLKRTPSSTIKTPEPLLSSPSTSKSRPHLVPQLTLYR